MEKREIEKELEIIRERIRFCRLKKGYSQDYMGHLLGTSQYAYNKMENGHTKLQISTLLKLEAIFGLEKWSLLKD
ncbi:MAG: helix-turn-helix transcriptional regulator [Flavobacteriaceae bacterium]